jgi:hypothetical protein
MNNVDTEVLFPLRVIPSLKELRGSEWAELVDRVQQADGQFAEKLAFVLMMVRLGGCVTCSADSFRAMRGCTQCARQTVRRYRGNDLELLEQFEHSIKEVEGYQQKGQVGQY